MNPVAMIQNDETEKFWEQVKRVGEHVPDWAKESVRRAAEATLRKMEELRADEDARQER